MEFIPFVCVCDLINVLAIGIVKLWLVKHVPRAPKYRGRHHKKNLSLKKKDFNNNIVRLRPNKQGCTLHMETS